MFEKIIGMVRGILGTDNELTDSIVIASEERITSPFYGYFVISWIIVNWRLIYIAFFVRGEDIFKKTNLLSNEYLFFNIPSFRTVGYWLDFLIYPFIATLFIFWLMPYITRIYFLKNIRNKKALKLIELNENKEIKKEEKELVVAEKNLIKEEVEKAKQIKRAIIEAPEVLWLKEYEQFVKNNLFYEFKKVMQKVYQIDSQVTLSASMVAFLDLNDIGSVAGWQQNVTLTDKGKFFARRFLENNPI